VDEVESAFDNEKRPAFIAATLPELKKRAKTMIVISHSPEADSGNFDVSWEIKNGYLAETLSENRMMVQ
jgi:ABC-type siderophore export system fused ATPase/permease subunit